MSVLVWADIPVRDLARATRFYSAVLGVPVGTPPGMDGTALVMGEAPSVDLFVTDPTVPITTAGTTIYFGGNGEMDAMLARVEEAGGKILQPKRFMGEMIGSIAFFEDTEGNRIGIQQPGE